MKATYSEAFKEHALAKVFRRGNRSIRAVADELNLNYFTLKNWMKKISPDGQSEQVARDKRPQDWRLKERLIALQESHGLEGEALNAWCRAQGLFTHHLAQWTSDFCDDAGAGDNRAGTRELRTLKEENQQLKRELSRKEKALAEAAALLVLQKKYRALLGGGRSNDCPRRAPTGG